jgi:collagenase-like PrtC family protease
MKFSLPTNWQRDLIPAVRDFKEIEQVYGKLTMDFVGGGRAAFTLPFIKKSEASKHLGEIRRAGLKFNYLLNSVCLNNREWTSRGQRQIGHLLEWLTESGIDSVTVSIPYLLEYIKRRFPHFKVEVSSLARVNSIERAKYWEKLGADSITLSFIDVNRSFRLLREIRRNIKCKLQLIGNLACLYRCPFFEYHSALPSHNSQSWHDSRGFSIDYCSISCRYMKIRNPSELIRACWIRPEDIHYYEDIGIDRIKLVDRTMTTEAIILILNAYSRRHYEGNLLDLFYTPSKAIILQAPNLLHKLKYFLRPFSINIFSLARIRKLYFDERIIYVDNRSLDGFIEHFLRNDCTLVSCSECGYCQETAKRVIIIDAAQQSRITKEHREFLKKLSSGSIFRYF